MKGLAEHVPGEICVYWSNATSEWKGKKVNKRMKRRKRVETVAVVSAYE